MNFSLISRKPKHTSYTVTSSYTLSSTTVINYGYLYNWYAATDAKNICSSGWHIPSYAEWTTLLGYYGGTLSFGFFALPNTIGGGLKESGDAHWGANVGATNVSLFNGIGSGLRDHTGTFSSMLTYAKYITSTALGSSCYSITLENTTAFLRSQLDEKIRGFSVRPIKDTTALVHGQSGTYIGNDGKVYRTICIGTQEWLADNLCETLYRDGSSIPVVTNAAAWAALITGARCSYDNDETNAFTTITTSKAISRAVHVTLSSNHPVVLPSFGFAVVENATPNVITIVYNAPLNETQNPDATFYGVAGNVVTSTDVVGNTVILTCANNFNYGDVILISYYPLSISTRVLGTNGLYAAGYVNKPVINNILSTSITMDNTIITMDSTIITMDQT